MEALRFDEILKDFKLPVQFVAHELKVFQQFLTTFTILTLLFIREQVVRYHLRMQTSTYRSNSHISQSIKQFRPK